MEEDFDDDPDGWLSKAIRNELFQFSSDSDFLGPTLPVSTIATPRQDALTSTSVPQDPSEGLELDMPLAPAYSIPYTPDRIDLGISPPEKSRCSTTGSYPSLGEWLRIKINENPTFSLNYRAELTFQSKEVHLTLDTSNLKIRPPPLPLPSASGAPVSQGSAYHFVVLDSAIILRLKQKPTKTLVQSAIGYDSESILSAKFSSDGKSLAPEDYRLSVSRLRFPLTPMEKKSYESQDWSLKARKETSLTIGSQGCFIEGRIVHKNDLYTTSARSKRNARDSGGGRDMQ